MEAPCLHGVHMAPMASLASGARPVGLLLEGPWGGRQEWDEPSQGLPGTSVPGR